jgi:hypothetical protein
MPDLISKSYFERTDFGSFGWIDKVVGDLWEVYLTTGSQSQTLSFRSLDAEKTSVYHYTQPQITGLVLWEYVWFSATAAQLGSFRSRDSEKLGETHVADFQIGWLRVPAGLFEFDPVPTIAAVIAQSGSFKSDKRLNRTSYQWHDQPLPGGWIAKTAESLIDVVDLSAAWLSQAGSFRSKDAEVLNVYHQSKLNPDWMRGSIFLGAHPVGIRSLRLLPGTRAIEIWVDNRVVELLPDTMNIEKSDRLD